MEVLSIDELQLQTKAQPEEITLKIAAAGFAMKATVSGTIHTIKKDDIREIEIYRSTQKYNMRVHCTNDTIKNINNIPETQIEPLKDVINSFFNLNVYVKELAFENINRGKLQVSGDFLEYKNDDDKLFFDVYLKDENIVSVHEMKNELTLAFKEVNNSVVEIKFTTGNDQLAKNIKERTESSVKSKELITFEVLQSVVPRGKNDFIFYDQYFKMIGGTYEHRIIYNSVKSIFYLEKENKEHYCCVMIDPPIRQGQTRYNFIVMIFNPEIEEEFEIQAGEHTNKFPNLKKTYSGALGETFINVVHAVTDVKITRNGSFMTVNNGKSLKCSLKAFDGHLYPLEKSLLFLPKAIYMQLNSITNVEFSRVNLSAFTAKTFDMKITTVEKEYTFNSLPKEDFGQLEQYFSAKNIKVTSEVMETAGISSEEAEEESEVQDDISSSSGND